MIENIFGTDGIRARMGQDPLRPVLLQKLGNSISQWAQKKYHKNPVILLGHDTRISCNLVKASLKAGMLHNPVTVYDGHILTSPAVSQLIKFQTFFDCGIIISASHNPYYDNGIKIIDKFLGKLSLEDELAISKLFHEELPENNYDYLGKEIMYTQAEEIYKNTLHRFFKPNFLHGIKIVLDCAHGAAYRLAPALFQTFGATVIPLHTSPNGTNINDKCGALHPETLQQAVVAYNADIGFAFDGDADRVVMVTSKGELKDGDDILALLLNNPLYKDTQTLVGTIMTNQGLEIFLNNNNKKLIRTPVGDKYIASSLIENNLLLGGEPSGHIIARDYLPTGDGIFIALRILETLNVNDTSCVALDIFKKFPQLIINLPITYKRPLTSTPLEELITISRNKLIKGRLIVRYSGTENLLRIMIEDIDYNHAHTIGTLLAQELASQLNEPYN